MNGFKWKLRTSKKGGRIPPDLLAEAVSFMKQSGRSRVFLGRLANGRVVYMAFYNAMPAIEPFAVLQRG